MMNTLIGCILIVGIFSNLTGYVLGYIHRSIHREKKEELAFRAGYKSAFEEWLGFDVSENIIEERYFEWKNRLNEKQNIIQH